MKKTMILMLGSCILIAAFITIKQLRKKTALYSIGILQTASHPALDAARDGFMAELNQLLPQQVDYIINNAQGSIPQAHTIAQQFHANTTCIGAACTVPRVYSSALTTCPNGGCLGRQSVGGKMPTL